jgi:NADH:ubiquinone reductase (H+-translocating)
MKINIPETGQRRVVIIGAGFGGLELAKRIAKYDLQIVLIDKNNFHQFQPLYYQVATAGLEPSSIAFPLRKMFQSKKNIFIRVTEVQNVDYQEKKINTELGYCWYDYLVVAIGADTNYYGNQKIAQFAIPMKTVSEALYLRNSIFEDYEKALTSTNDDEQQSYTDIVIVGGGPTGVELAGALAEMKKYILPKDYHELNSRTVDIYLIQSSDVLLKGMSEKAALAAEGFLTKLGVIIKKNTRVTDYDGEVVTMNDGATIHSKKVIWAAGIRGNTLAGLPEGVVMKDGRIMCDNFNKINGLENVFAIGDIAYMEENSYKGHPQVAQVAIQQAKQLAVNFRNILTNDPLETFHYRDLGSMATIGRNHAVVDLPFVKFQGFFAWLVWLFVHLFSIIGVKNKIFIFLNWVWNYFTYDQSLRLIIKPRKKPLV